MSVKTKSSQTTGGCCERTATLQIEEFNFYVAPPAIFFPSWESRYLDDIFAERPLKSRMYITSNASEKCKRIAAEIILRKMTTSIFLAFRGWKQIASRDMRNLFEIGGTFTPLPFDAYDLINFKTNPGSWDFKIKCCDKLDTASIITSFDNFPTIYGFQASHRNLMLFPGWRGPSLEPPIICRL